MVLRPSLTEDSTKVPGLKTGNLGSREHCRVRDGQVSGAPGLTPALFFHQSGCNSVCMIISMTSEVK